ncbi:hypothetical protein [Planctobacterium marinum]|uniref:Uncharacterized protein n=1 Tax=Planctobacterium marinum TaxID=1631968 RepID=A0AA48HXW0_9ALTE|nr:hypothetical protein MACH26_34090 [Planctobacterium marinum]
MSDLNKAKQALFMKWTESELTDHEQQLFEQYCIDDEDFADKVSVHGRLQQMSEHYEAAEVPDWDRSTGFSHAQASPWWQWKGLPALSFATSIAAILLVTLKLEFTVHDGSMTISFSGAAQQKQIEQLVNERIAEYAALQNSKFEEQAELLQNNQMQMNTQLANYVLATSRTERREDFAELIKHVNEQREDDQVFYARQINRLKTDINANSRRPDWLSELNEQPNSEN